MTDDRNMRTVSSHVLEDPTYTVPTGSHGASGLAWLRHAVARFSDGDAHAHRRALVVRCLEGLGEVTDQGSPTRSLLVAFGLPGDLDADVSEVAASYQPHAPQTHSADAAADRLVAACGGRTERAAAAVCVLVQAHAATAALIDGRRSGSTEPPVPSTRRVSPDGDEVMVDLRDAPFGRGAHRCPGEPLALRLADLFSGGGRRDRER